MGRVVGALDKIGVGGVMIAALSCAACFPALGALAAALGLGFLSQLEGLAINRLLPTFAIVALAVNAYGWSQHRVHWRGILSVLGPTAILATLYPLWQYGWSTYLFYSALVLMLVVSVSDLTWPAQITCLIPGGGEMSEVITESQITCPTCGHQKLEVMPVDACQWFYECEGCHEIIKPKQGDCCVYCSYGSVKCPPIQAGSC